MIKVLGQLEDIEYSFIRDDGAWTHTTLNTRTLHKSVIHHLTDEQVGACLALMAAGDFSNEELNNKLWDIALDAIGSLHDDVRIIP